MFVRDDRTMITDIAYTELGFQNLTKKPVTYFDNDYTEDERGFYFSKIISPKRVARRAQSTLENRCRRAVNLTDDIYF